MKFYLHFWFVFFFPGIGGSSKSSTSSNVDSSTKIDTKNQQVGASEGSFGVGGTGNTVSMQTVDAGSVDALKSVAGQAISANSDVAKTTTADALNFGETALDNVRKTTESANDLLSRSYETYAGGLQRNAGDAPGTIAQDSMKNILYAFGALVVGAIAFAYINRK